MFITGQIIMIKNLLSRFFYCVVFQFLNLLETCCFQIKKTLSCYKKACEKANACACNDREEAAVTALDSRQCSNRRYIRNYSHNHNSYSIRNKDNL